MWGSRLAEYFRTGAQPAVQPSPIALAAGERYHYGTPVQVWQWLEGDGGYTHSSGVAIGGIGFMAAFYAANAIGNASRRAQAARDAQAQWRQIGAGHLHLTSERIAIQGLSEWVEFGHGQVRSSTCNDGGVTMDIDGWAQTHFATALPHYWFGMFRKLAYDEIVDPSIRPSAAQGQLSITE